MPNRFFFAKLSARVRAFVAAREAADVGDAESWGAFGLGGGGNVGAVLGEPLPERLNVGGSVERGDDGSLRSFNGLRLALISATKVSKMAIVCIDRDY